MQHLCIHSWNSFTLNKWPMQLIYIELSSIDSPYDFNLYHSILRSDKEVTILLIVVFIYIVMHVGTHSMHATFSNALHQYTTDINLYYYANIFWCKILLSSTNHYRFHNTYIDIPLVINECTHYKHAWHCYSNLCYQLNPACLKASV